MSSSTRAVLVTLVVYKLVLIALGIWAQRRTRTGEDFFLGGRGLGPVVAAVSASASSSSVWTLLGVSGAAYRLGLGAIWLFPACVGGFVLNWWLVAPRLRRLSLHTRALTVTELLARGDRRVVVLGSVMILVSLCAYVAAQFLGAGKVFNETFALPMRESIFVGSVIVVIYTLLGGFWAVSLTDTLQGLLMAATAILLPTAAVATVGFEALFSVDEPGYASLTHGMAPAAAIGFILGFLGIGIGYPGQPHVVNRFMALRDERAVRIARWVAIAWAVVVYAGMLLLGWAGRVLLPDIKYEVVFITTTQELFSPVVAGVMLAAVLSAIMSTADSQLLVAASAVTHDLGLGRRRLVLSSRLVIVLLSGGAAVAALYGPPEIFNRVLFAWTALGAAFGPLLLVTLLRGPVPPVRTLAAMTTGFALSVIAHSFEATKNGAVERVVPFLVALVIAVAGPMASGRDRTAGRTSPADS